MTTEEIQALCDECIECKGNKYLRIDCTPNKTLLVGNPVTSPGNPGKLIIRSVDAYEICRYYGYQEYVYGGNHINTCVKRIHNLFFILGEGDHSIRVHKTPYNETTAKRLIKTMLFTY